MNEQNYVTEIHHEAYLMYKMVVLHYENQMSQSNIAQQVGKTKSAVRVVLDKFKTHANVHYVKPIKKEKKTDEEEIAAFINELLKQIMQFHKQR